MATSIRKRVVIAAVCVVAALAGIALAGLYFVQREVRARIVEVLGPLGSAERIDVGLSSVRLVKVRLKAPSGWPTPDVLRADQITLTPDIRDLLARRVHLRDIVVSGFDLTVLRTKDGKLRLLPNLRQSSSNAQAAGAASTSASSKPSPSAEKLIDHIVFEHGTFEFYDLSVSDPAYRVTVSDANATVDHLHLPALSEPTTVAVTGSIKGPQHTGTVSFGGWIKIASKDSQTTTTLRGVDVVTLDPYLLKKAGAKARVNGGTLDLSIDSTVRDYQLHAPGTLTLHDLQIAPSDDPLDTFMSIPTRVAIAALKLHSGAITLHFVLDGNLKDPKFTLDDNFATELRAGLAKVLGVSAEGVAKGAGQTVKGLGNALLNLIGQ
ncbi:DUF748 domain-containing protein [Paraburkholderia megapolitana]|uniref:DUF748 domain-containing protein n=1 Tax=Paraburkholderia megapolitana TaxID=420953 RepID=A0A1I3VHK5_9BURK|nr:DUF748 domain-containing protein [Paraburkholderia megapolitana]QDQ85460.1 DUF748 domain-containing protein [Paraburkholderia megapolitana]SFJ93707.1 protein of unknown function [Paraburkholderia megapolitana]